MPPVEKIEVSITTGEPGDKEAFMSEVELSQDYRPAAHISEYGGAAMTRGPGEEVKTVQEGERMGQPHQLMVGMVVALALLLLMLILLMRRARMATTAAGIATTTVKQSGKKGVVLVGCSGSGKTRLFHRLVSPPGSPAPETLPSMVAAYGEIPIVKSGGGGCGGAPGGGGGLTVVDCPGHERLWPTMLQQVVGARGVVLVVDPTANAAIKKSALLLFELLASPTALAAGVSATPLLVFCNKRDVAGAKDPARVVKMLQNEMEGLRKSSATMEAAALDGMSRAEKRRPVGVVGRPFKLVDDPCTLSSVTVSVASGSAVADGGLGELSAFMSIFAR